MIVTKRLKPYFRAISLVLMILLLLMSIPVIAGATKTDSETNESAEVQSGYGDSKQNTEGDLPLDVLAKRVLPEEDIPEVVSKKTIEENGHVNRLWAQETDLNSIIFQNRDGSKTMYYFADTVKYEDENGIIRDKRNTVIELIERKDYAFVNDTNDIKTYFPEKIGVDKGILLDADGIKIEMTPVLGKGSKSDVKAEEAKALKVITKDDDRDKDTIVYDGVFGKDTALSYTPQFTGFKEDIILYSYTEINEFTFLIRTNGLSLVKNEFGEYSFLDPLTGKIKAQLGNIYIYDSSDVGATDYMENMMYTHRYQMTTVKEDNEYLITIVVDEKYLTNKDRVWPVYVDPNITVSGSGTSKTIQDVPVYSGKPTNNYGANTYLHLGYYDSSYKAGRTLMKFPGLESNTTFSNLVPSQITSLKLYLYENSGTSNTATIKANLYTGAVWSESGAKCNNVGWSSFSTELSSVSMNTAGWKEFDLKKAVNLWKSSPNDLNRGIMLRNSTSESTASYLKTFMSTEYSSGTDRRPYVSFTYNNAMAQNPKITNYKWYYIDTFVTSGRSLTVEGGSLLGGTNLLLSRAKGNTAQQFRIIWQPDIGYKLELKESSRMAVSVDNSNQLIIEEYNSVTLKHHWDIYTNLDGTFGFMNCDTGGVMYISSMAYETYANVDRGSNGYRKWNLLEVTFGCGGTYRDVKAGTPPNCLGYALFMNEEFTIPIDDDAIEALEEVHYTVAFTPYIEEFLDYYTEYRPLANFRTPVQNSEYRIAIRYTNGINGYIFHVIYQLSDGRWAGKNDVAISRHFSWGDPSVSPDMWEDDLFPEWSGTIYYAVIPYLE